MALFFREYRNIAKEVLQKKHAEAATRATGTGTLTMDQLCLNEQLSDFTIQCGDEKIPAHACALSFGSPVFMKMFSQNMQENDDRTLVMKDTPAPVMKEVLRFIYTSNVDVLQWSTNFTKEVYACADYFQVAKLKEICEDKILAVINVENIVEIYKWIVQYKVEKGQVRVGKFVRLNKRQIVQHHTIEGLTTACPEMVKHMVLGIKDQCLLINQS